MSGAEIFGYVASLLVAASLLMRSILRLRIVNLVGAVCFTAYGVMIHAYPVALVNFAIVVINVYRLYEIASAREQFKLVQVAPGAEYLAEFLRYHAEEIERFNPGATKHVTEEHLVLFALRDMVPAGLFVGRREGPDTLRVELDYVIPGYRDFKLGPFVFGDHREVFTRRGIGQLVSAPGSPEHEGYLKRMGFHPETTATGERIYRLTLA